MKRAAVLILALLWAVQNLWAATHPWFPDALSEGLNLIYSVEAYEGLIALFEGQEGALSKLTWQGFPYGPPLYLSAALSEWAVGSTEPWVRLLPIQLCGLLSLLGCFVLARRLSGRTAALWATGMLATAPMFTYYARHFTTELPLMALFTWVLVAALRSGGFSRTRPTLAFGALLGLAVMTKPSALQLLFFPLVLYFGWTVLLGRSFPGDPETADALPPRLKAALPRLGGAAALSLLIPWPYVRHLFEGRGQFHLRRYALGPTDAWGIEPRHYYPLLGDEGVLQWLTFYPRMLLRYQLGLLLCLLILGLCIAALRARRPGAIWAVLGFLGTMLLYAFIANRKWYYTLPSLPLLMVAAGIGAKRVLRGRAVPAVALLLLSLWTHAAWIGGSGLVWNRPALLQVAPARVAEDPDLPLRIAQEIAADPALSIEVLILSPVHKKAVPHPRNLPIAALEHQLQYLVLNPRQSTHLGAVDDPEQLRATLKGGVDRVLFETPGMETWLSPENALLQQDPSLRAPLAELQERGELRVLGTWHGWTIRLLRYQPRFKAP